MKKNTKNTIPFCMPSGATGKGFINKLHEIESNLILTNRGSFTKQLENKITQKVGANNTVLTCNGTLALHLAIKSIFGLRQLLTTPISYFSTVACLKWENILPTFIDVEEETLCLNPNLINQNHIEQNQAIMPVHLYGNLADVETFEKLNKEFNTPIIYDSSHAFGSTYKGKKVGEFGTINTYSFHATKLYHTIEGGALSTNNTALGKKLLDMAYPNLSENPVMSINAKMSELHAAVGLEELKKFSKVLKKRQKQWFLYRDLLTEKKLKTIKLRDELGFNGAYFPLIFPTEKQCLQALEALTKNNITAKRYFFPSLETYFKQKIKCPIAFDYAKRVICLPLFHHLTMKQQKEIAHIILKNK